MLIVFIFLFLFLFWNINPVSISLFNRVFFIYLIMSFLFALLFYKFLLEYKNKKTSNMFIKIFSSIIIIMILYFLLTFIFESKLINSKKYSNLINIEDANFKDNVKEISINNLAILDKESAALIGDRKMGELLDLASQFNISNEYIHINYQGKGVRVSPLSYRGFFKWLNNKKEGIPGYVVVDMTNGKAEIKRTKKPIRYSHGDYFFRDIDKYVYINNIGKNIGHAIFEIDDEGNPYWVSPIIENNIGLYSGKDTIGIILTNAYDGSMIEYSLDEIPNWVDRVHNANHIIKQIDDWGSLKGGYINSIFAQNNVLYTSEGYNYLSLNDDIYLYSGITTASNDSSNVGFILSNLRTKETLFFKIPAADESSAMLSAEGQIQEKEYSATFPILINLNDNPVYVMSLKDKAGLIKSYAVVDATDYQNVVVEQTLQLAIDTFNKNDINFIEKEKTKQENEEKKQVSINIESIKEVVIDGYTNFIIKSNNKQYIINIKDDINSIYLNQNDKILVEIKKETEKDDLIKIYNILEKEKDS